MFGRQQQNLVCQKICVIPEKKKYGWKRDIPDQRDIYYKENLSNKQLPKIVDFRNKCPDIYNQGTLGSCTANAIAFLFEFDEIMKNKD